MIRHVVQCPVTRIGLVVMALVSSCAVVPARRPATVAPAITAPSGPPGLQVSLRTAAATYTTTSDAIQVIFANDSTETVYLAICGPWEIARPGEPDRPVWDILCEIDYLGHKVEPGGVFTRSLSLERMTIEPGAYIVQGNVYADCTLGEPYQIDANETNYGAFGDCMTRVRIESPSFTIE